MVPSRGEPADRYSGRRVKESDHADLAVHKPARHRSVPPHGLTVFHRRILILSGFAASADHRESTLTKWKAQSVPLGSDNPASWTHSRSHSVIGLVHKACRLIGVKRH